MTSGSVHCTMHAPQCTVRSTSTTFGFAVNNIRTNFTITTYLWNARMCRVFFFQLSALIGSKVACRARPNQEVVATVIPSEWTYRFAVPFTDDLRL